MNNTNEYEELNTYPRVLNTSISIPGLIKVKKLSENAKIPFRATKSSAGFDLYSAENITLPAGKRVLVSTDIAIEMERNYYGRIAPRSSLALKYGIDVGAGVIDNDYRGNINVLLFNFGEEDFEIKIGDRIAQLIVELYYTGKMREVCELNQTERGDGGFGSTGTN